MAKAEDMGDYYRIPADNRDLNYDKYHKDGDKKINAAVEYGSHNTERLTVEEMRELLKKLSYFK